MTNGVKSHQHWGVFLHKWHSLENK